MYKLLSILALVGASSTATAATPTVNPSPKTEHAASAQKYCLQMDQVTGSRVREAECRTKADWKKQGVDVDQLLAKGDRSDDQG